MKEWKGNSDSVRSRLAINKAHTTKGRETDDFYATDPKAVARLISAAPHIFYPAREHGTTIWECACGTGNLAKELYEQGHVVYASDLKHRGYGAQGLDFLAMSKQHCLNIFNCIPSIILTNPPYSLANEFILHALDILPDGGLYIALMNITYLCGQKRYEQIYSKGALREVYLFSKRIECWRNNDREQYGGKAMADFAWYVFQKGYNGQPTLYWL